ncbi:MAG: HAD-IA family hydrolase, partial [Planctomycetota bacterium]
DPAEQPELFERLYAHEDRAARAAELADGCQELLAWLHENAMPTAVITRNSAASAKTIWQTHGLPELPIYSRDEAPPKPDPTVVFEACRRFELRPADVWMVGDGIFDVEVARNAGATGVWLSLGRDLRPFEAEPHLTVAGLPELLAVLRNHVTGASE